MALGKPGSATIGPLWIQDSPQIVAECGLEQGSHLIISSFVNDCNNGLSLTVSISGLSPNIESA